MPVPAANARGQHPGFRPQGPGPGWNQNSGSLSAKPQQGWLHPDETICGDGVRFHVNYVGCVAIKESMRSLDFDKRTNLAREAICQVVHGNHYKRLENWRPQSHKNGVSRLLDSRCRAPASGARVILTVSTEAITLEAVDTASKLLRHEMCSISFASGGDGETTEFVGYVAKDSEHERACHVVEVPALAADVIATIGQAFELRYKQHIQGTNVPGVSGHLGPGGQPLHAQPDFLQPTFQESKWGDETASQLSSDTSQLSNHPGMSRPFLTPAQNPPGLRQMSAPGGADLIDLNSNMNKRNSSFLTPCFEDNFNDPHGHNASRPSDFHNGQTPQPLPGLANRGLPGDRGSMSTFGVAPPIPGNNPLQPRKPPVFTRQGSDHPHAAELAAVLHPNQRGPLSPQSMGAPIPGHGYTGSEGSADGIPPRLPDRPRVSPRVSGQDPRGQVDCPTPTPASHHAHTTSAPNQNPRPPSRQPPAPSPGGPGPGPPAAAAAAGGEDAGLITVPLTEEVVSLASQPWFHGAISRAEAEQRLIKDGDFLVREKPPSSAPLSPNSAPPPTQYVLSGSQAGQVKHLLLVDPVGRVRTKHNVFHNVAHLITHHMKLNIPIISSDSQVRLGNPVFRPVAHRPGLHATDL